MKLTKIQTAVLAWIVAGKNTRRSLTKAGVTQPIHALRKLVKTGLVVKAGSAYTINTKLTATAFTCLGMNLARHGIAA